MLPLLPVWSTATAVSFTLVCIPDEDDGWPGVTSANDEPFTEAPLTWMLQRREQLLSVDLGRKRRFLKVEEEKDEKWTFCCFWHAGIKDVAPSSPTVLTNLVAAAGTYETRDKLADLIYS